MSVAIVGLSLTACALALLPATASAGRAEQVGPGSIQFTAFPGETNRVEFVHSGGWFFIEDTGAPIQAGNNCKPQGPNKVKCSDIARYPNSIWRITNQFIANLGDMDDRFNNIGAEGYPHPQANGEAGNDTLTGDSGDDFFSGGPDDDTFQGNGGRDTVSYYDHGTQGVTADLDGALRDDGSPGEHDTISSDVEDLYGSDGPDRLTGDGQSNYIVGYGGNDTSYGLAGDDHLVDSSCSISAFRVIGCEGGSSGDTMMGGPGADYLMPGSGRDTIDGDDAVNYAGDVASYADHYDDIPVTADLDGASGDDGVPGEGDTIRSDVENLAGGEGDDRLTGNAAVNALFGNLGSDTLSGDGGDDVLDGFLGGDTLYGDGGNDQLDGGYDADTLIGGPGTQDTADYSAREESVRADLDGDADDGESGEGDTVTTSVEAITGGTGNDKLFGNAQGNYLVGGDGDDTITAGGGNDWLIGNDDADNLKGEAGFDVLVGLLGNDTFDGGADFDALTDELFASGGGKDTFKIRDGHADTISFCGTEKDSVTTDAQGIDTIPGDCETVSYQ